MMRGSKQKALERHGWRVGGAPDFLALSREEAAFIEYKIALAHDLRSRRRSGGLSQAALAKRLKSSQSRVAKMEAAHASVSVDLLLRALFALGATTRDVGKLLLRREAKAGKVA